MIDVQNIAVTATFILSGMRDVEEKHRVFGPDGKSVYDLYTVWGKGAIELHQEVSFYAGAAERLCNLYTVSGEIDFPGVFDYEVSEPFGRWLAEALFKDGRMPSKITAVKHLTGMVLKFFDQGQKDISEKPAEDESFSLAVSPIVPGDMRLYDRKFNLKTVGHENVAEAITNFADLCKTQVDAYPHNSYTVRLAVAIDVPIKHASLQYLRNHHEN